MGAWGTTLYANDTACDIRGDYVDKLKRGKTNIEATQELIKQNESIIGDVEEEPLFWYALADTQWNYGRLLPEVKEKALFFIRNNQEIERWRDSGEEKMNKWLQALRNLEKKLNEPLPKEKKVYKYRFYQCQWKLGDVYAYRFSSDYSKEKNFYGKYVVFRKVSEDTWWPGHIIPIVQVYKWIGDEIPALEIIRKEKLLIQNFVPITLKYQPNIEKEYFLELITNSKKDIPYENLTYLGNIPGEDLVEFRGYDYFCNYSSVGWEGKGYNQSFEKYIINQYTAWNEFE